MTLKFGETCDLPGWQLREHRFHAGIGIVPIELG